MTTTPTAPFALGEKVTYGNHGVGTVMGLVTERVLGQDVRLYELQLGAGAVIKVSEPVAKRDFKVVAKTSQLAAVIAVLQSKPKTRRGAWHQTERRYAAILGTQDAVALAELVRDSHPRDTSPNFTILMLYRTGLYQLVQLLVVTEEMDESTVLEEFNAKTELNFRVEDAKPVTYGANQRTTKVTPAQVKPSQVPVVKSLPARAIPRSPLEPKPPARLPSVKVSVSKVSSSQPTTKAPVIRQRKAEAATLPPKTVTSPPASVTRVRFEPVTQSVDSSESVISTLRETIARQQNEIMRLKTAVKGSTSLEAGLEAARKQILSLRSQLSAKDEEQRTVSRERQRHDREQAERETVLAAHNHRLVELLGACLLASGAFAEQVISKTEKLASVPTRVPESDEAMKTLRRQLGDVRRSNTAMKKRLEDRRVEVARLKTSLREAQTTIAQQAVELQGQDSDVLIKALIERKEEIDALRTTIITHEKEVRRLNARIRALDEDLATRKEERLTKEQVLAKIETVQADLFQYIYERTAQVERLQAYIKELKTIP